MFRATTVQHTVSDDGDFGIAVVTAQDATKCTSQMVNLIVTVDVSGSMNDVCPDGKTKLDHAKHMMANLVDFLGKCPLQNPDDLVLLSVATFDHEITNLATCVNIRSSDERSAVKAAIFGAKSRGSTDIELAIKNGVQLGNSVREVYGDGVRIAHLFLTDGRASEGNCDTEYLKSLPSSEYTNFFVGFGQDHHYQLLKGLGSNPRAGYYFVESLEKAGMVYGELLHRVMFAVPGVVSLHIKGGKLYDFSSGSWTSDPLPLYNLAAGDRRTLHFVPDDSSVVPTLTVIDDIASYEVASAFIAHDAIDVPEGLGAKSLIQAEWRQKVLEYLNECMQVAPGEAKTEPLRAKGEELMGALNQVMEERGWKEDAFMKQLRDDVYVGKKALSCHNGNMYAGARLQSCGQQRSYNVVDLSQMTPRAAASGGRPPPHRSSSVGRAGSFAVRRPEAAARIIPLEGAFTPPEMVSPPADDDAYLMSQHSQSCFASPAQAQIMHVMSAGVKPRGDGGGGFEAPHHSAE